MQQGLTYEELAGLIPELTHELIGSKLTDVKAIAPKAFIFTFDSRALLVSLEKPFVRLHLTEHHYQATPTKLSKALLKQLEGGSLTEISLLGKDRIVRLAISFPDGQKSVIIELLSSRPNILLVNERDEIQAALFEADGSRFTLPPKSPHIPGEATAITSRQIEERVERESFELKRSALLADLKRAQGVIQRRLSKLEADLAAAKRWEEVFHEAELLQANFHLLRKGVAEVTVSDWQTGDERTVATDAKFDPAKQVSSRFKLARSLKRALPHLDEQIAKKQSELAANQALLEQVRSASSSKDLPISLEERALAPKTAATRLPFRRFKTRDGLEILAGRNDRENSLLTFNHAHGSDWWFHANNYPGSHVVLRVAKDQIPTMQALQDALQVAAHFSQAKDNTVVEICVTQVKYLRRPPGGKLGQVLVSQHKVMEVRPNPEHLKELRNRPHETGC